MAEIRLSPTALAGFDEIVDYLMRVARSRVAANYAERLHAAVNSLAGSPGLGSPRRNLGRRTRMSGVGPFLIFYDGGPRSKIVHVLRILRGRRNITPALIARGRGP